MVTNGRKSNLQRVFIWQAILILLPVFVLALVGFSFLRQDRLLARREAQQRAQEIADELLPKCLSALLLTKGPGMKPPHQLLLTSNGELVSPTPISVATPKFLDLSLFSPDQLDLWRQMQGFGQAGGLHKQLEAARNLASSKVPDSLLGIVLFWLGSLEQQQGNTTEAVHVWERLLHEFPQATGETGLPLAPLANLKILQIMYSTNRLSPAMGITAADLCSNVVSRPTQLSEPILDAVTQITATTPETSAMESWRKQWEIDQATRQLYAALRGHLDAARVGAPFWFQMDTSLSTQTTQAGRWLAFPPELATTRASATRSAAGGFTIPTPLASAAEPQILDTQTMPNTQSAAARALSSSQKQADVLLYAYAEPELWLRQIDHFTPGTVPPYLGVGIQVAGRSITPSSSLHLWREVGYIGRKGGGVRKEVQPELATEVLGSAAQTWAGGDFLRVNVYLTSPSDLFKRQRTRTFWLGSVIAASFLAAIAGLLATWRSFSHQEQLAEMKTNFVSSVSHELRAPIASVRLLAESLERGSVSTSEKQTQYYHFIGQECRRLSSLIENVLDFSRIEQGRKQYEFEPADVVALVQQTVTLMNPYAQERAVSLLLEVAGSIHEHLEMSLDGQAIQQALINLIDNALKHSEKGKTIKVGLAIKPKPSDGTGEPQSCVQIFVEDEGPGIPQTEHEKIFERFYRLGSELRRETQGIGIGLSIVKHIVEAHRGKVIVRSSPGTGSRFTIELPMKTEIVA